jgi:hypothetical protein
MFRLYKLETEKRNKSNLETIYDYLDLYNGHTGYTLLAEVKTEQKFNSIVINFVEKWKLGENKITALVIEDTDENVIDILYETENMELKWSENNLPKNFIHNFFSKNCMRIKLENGRMVL